MARAISRRALGWPGAVTLVYIALLAAGRLTGFVRESLIAYLFGATGTTDAYVAATTLPELAAGVLLAGVVGYAIIPALAESERRGDRESVAEILRAALTYALLACGALSLIGVLLATPIMSVVAPGLHDHGAEQAATLFRISSMSVLFFGLAGVAAALLNARHIFLPVPISLLAGNIVAVAILLALERPLGIDAAGWAYVGAAAGAAVVQWVLLMRIQRPPLRPLLRSQAAARIVRTGGVAALAISVPFLRFVIERILGSTLPSGDLASLGFATRIVLLAAAVIAVPVGTVAFPRMAHHAAAADREALRCAFQDAVRTVLVISVPVCFLLVVFGRTVVAVAFEHGRFGSAASALTASILRIYAVGLVGMCVTEILLRMLFVLREERFALVSFASTVALGASVNLALIGPLGARGLAAGSAIAIWANVALMAFWVSRHLADDKSAVAPDVIGPSV
jgi:putative peptidoglycan lipid II flippase